ncbi:MAG: hypothetical protein DSY80_05835 [Desulfocapsa sp.]|nr:MAG: hypothetical protein DSY80_05835 [Desulfocapsa sp.]
MRNTRDIDFIGINMTLETIIAVISAIIIPLIVFYFQRARDLKNDDASLAEKYQDIASKEIDYRVKMEAAINARIDVLEKKLADVEKERDVWRELAEKYKAELEKAERRIAKLREIIEKMSSEKWD